MCSLFFGGCSISIGTREFFSWIAECLLVCDQLTHSYRQVCNVQDSAEHPLNRWGGGKDSGDFLDCIVLADFSAIFPDSESESDNVSLHAMTNSPREEGACVLPFRLLYCSSRAAQPLRICPHRKVSTRSKREIAALAAPACWRDQVL